MALAWLPKATVQVTSLSSSLLARRPWDPWRWARPGTCWLGDLSWPGSHITSPDLSCLGPHMNSPGLALTSPLLTFPGLALTLPLLTSLVFEMHSDAVVLGL